MVLVPFVAKGVLLGDQLVTATIRHQRINNSSLRHHIVDFDFGNGATTYNSGGITVTLADVGFRQQIISATILDSDSDQGLVYKYDSTNDTVRVYAVDGSTGVTGSLRELTTTDDVTQTALLIEFMGH